MGDFHDFSLKNDVLLLVNVFHEIKNMCLYYYGLDFSHCFSSPGLNWNAMLKIKEVK